MKTLDSKNIKKLLAGVKENVSLADYTSFKIGGKTRYFFVAKNKEDLIKAIAWAKKLNLPFFVLGGGTNLLVSDRGFNGLVIKNLNTKYYILNTKIIAGAGTLLAELVAAGARNNLTGLEWAAGIPGTVGGAIYGNAKVFKDEMGNIVKSALVLDLQSGKVKKFSDKDCQFGYKTSIFKKKKKLIIVSAELKLSKSSKEGIKNKIRQNLDYRKKAQPLLFPSAGSVFINPKLQIKNKKLLKEFPELADFNKRGFIPAGFLIDRCGLKGKSFGQAKISEKHANFIVNAGRASSDDVLKLIRLIKRKVKNKFGVELEEEIQIL